MKRVEIDKHGVLHDIDGKTAGLFCPLCSTPEVDVSCTTACAWFNKVDDLAQCLGENLALIEDSNG